MAKFFGEGRGPARGQQIFGEVGGKDCFVLCLGPALYSELKNADNHISRNVSSICSGVGSIPFISSGRVLTILY